MELPLIISRIFLLFGIFSDCANLSTLPYHIRFFTIKKMKNILSLTGFEVEKVRPVPLTVFSPVLMKSLDFLANLRPSLIAYHVLYMAKKVSLPKQDRIMVIDHPYKLIQVEELVS